MSACEDGAEIYLELDSGTAQRDRQIPLAPLDEPSNTNRSGAP
jgi:hypothetical protein